MIFVTIGHGKFLKINLYIKEKLTKTVIGPVYMWKHIWGIKVKLYSVLSLGVGDGSALHSAYITSRKEPFYPFNRGLVGPQNRSGCYFNTCTMHLILFCTMTNKCTIISQIITFLHVSTLSCHLQGACN